MRRQLFRLASVLSLLLCAGVAVFWVRSYTLGDELRYHRDPRDFEIESNTGLVFIAWGQMVSRNYPPPPGLNGSFWPFDRRVEFIEADLHNGTTLGFAAYRWRRSDPDFRVDVRGVTLPWPVVFACFAAVPLVWSLNWRKRRRRRVVAGRACLTCGYNLSGNTSGTCPECGTPLPQESEAGA